MPWRFLGMDAPGGVQVWPGCGHGPGTPSAMKRVMTDMVANRPLSYVFVRMSRCHAPMYRKERQADVPFHER